VKSVLNAVKNFMTNSVLRASSSCSKVLKDKKIFQHSEKFQGNSVFQGKQVVQKSE